MHLDFEITQELNAVNEQADPQGLDAQIRQLFASRLARVVQDAIASMSDELRMNAESDPAGLDTVLGAADILDRHQNAIKLAFSARLGELFDQRLRGITSHHSDTDVDTDADTLTLVDDSSIRDRILIEHLAATTYGALDSDEVLGIRARLGDLVGRDWFSEKEHPASPEVVFEALRFAIDSLEGDDIVRNVLLNAFEPHLTRGLNSVYCAMNTRLKSAQILPVIKRKISVSPNSSDPKKPAPASEKTAANESRRQFAAPSTEGDNQQDTFVLPPAGPERDAIIDVLARQVADGGQQARRSAVQLLSSSGEFAISGAAQSPPDAQLIDALDVLQNDQAGAHSPDQALNVLTDQARDKGSALDQLTVEIVSLIFDFIYDDPRIPEAIKNQLLRLQVVAVKAALLDRSFFASRQHPMRRLIDRATDVSGDPDVNAETGSVFATRIQEIVDQVLADFDRDLSVFDQALEQIAQIELDEHRRRSAELAELTEAAGRSELHALAKESAQAEIESRIDDMTPQFVVDFLSDVWIDVLCVAKLASETQFSWDDALNLSEQLLWSVADKSAADVKRMAAMLPNMIAGIADGLNRIECSDGQHRRFFDELMKWHTRTINTAKQRATRPVVAVGSALPSPHLDATSLRHAGPSDEASQQTGVDPVDRLARGQRLNYDEPGQATISVKLAWISPARKLFALSRFPDFARSVTRADMAQLLSCGRVVPIQTDAIVDQAIHAVGSV